MNIMSKTKKDIIEEVAEQLDISKKAAGEAVSATFDAITETLRDGGDVTIIGFGKFEVAERAAREGVNPATGDRITIAASKAPKFRAAKALKDTVNHE